MLKKIFAAVFNILKYLWWGILSMVDPDYVIAKEVDGLGRTDDRDNAAMGSPAKDSKTLKSDDLPD